MFGLSLKKKLMRIILKISADCLDSYKNSIRDIYKQSTRGIERDEFDSIIWEIRKKYLNDVSSKMLTHTQSISPMTGIKISLYMDSPLLCGYNLDFSDGIVAGFLYAIYYHACSDKVAAPKDCVSLNHLQEELMHQALVEIENEVHQ